ncbi:MAG: AAA family ATPase [Bacteroidota bacterium]
MKHSIKELAIKNYKSIDFLSLDCKRINLFVGEPNIGKSNILEAISFYGFANNRSNKFMGDFIRYENFTQLFHNQNIASAIVVASQLGALWTRYDYTSSHFEFCTGYFSQAENQGVLDTAEINRANLGRYVSDLNHRFLVENECGNISELGDFRGQPKGHTTAFVKKYSFKQTSMDDLNNGLSLFPPHGTNLFRTLETHPLLQEEVADLLDPYELKLALRKAEKRIEIQKEVNRVTLSFPYISLADTLRRIIFYYAAIISNKEAILLLEEPESHFFPPYVKNLAFKIVEDTQNQYFITTHSPQLFNSLVENTPEKELAVFATFYENGTTKSKELSGNELSEILDEGINVFSNIKRYTNE